ncbi:secreted RxLR effector protein 161-like [Apium graveolens]|uniref:secreted RxLR effector protein 161-like n=1 Tax=Apium graveolens TaxID=4045 RepID=UPI003D792AD0
MAKCNPCKYPMDPKEVITKNEGGKAVDAIQFKSLVGGLRYLVHTCPDIVYAMGVISRHMERPTIIHLNAAKHILRYIHGTLNLGLVYTKDCGNNLLTGYSDSNLAGNLDDRRSTGAMVFYLNECLVTWVSQKQHNIALSSYEAEYMAAAIAACQGIWLRNVMMQVTGERINPVVIYVDNRSTIDLARNPVSHKRNKHIDIRFYFIRECIDRGEIVIKHIGGESQRADILT